MLLNNRGRLDEMDVILSGAKDPTLGRRAYCNRLKGNEAKMIGAV